ncbi:MAG: energy-coupling factor transporter ATPase [Elainellaceae cyanobacterium]
MQIVSAKDFKFTYPGAEERALNGVSFNIRRGEVLGIIGPVGAGKTTLCMAIAGFAPRITGGEVSGEISAVENGHRSTQGQQHPQNSQHHPDDEQDHPVGMVFEDYAGQLTQLRVLDEVKTPLLNRGFSEEQAESQARELLNQVGLDPDQLQKKRVWELSGGQQQRLAIAATLALDPQILIFDKAIDRLDPRGQEKVRQIIKGLGGDKTLVVVEQDTHLLRDIADRILVIVDGVVIAEGKPEDILRDEELVANADATPPVSLQVARALGLSQAPLTIDEFEQAIDHKRSSDQRSYYVYKPAPLDYDQLEPDQAKYSTQSDQKSVQQSDQPLVQIERLSFRYPDGTQALKDVSFQLHAGEVHAIVGNSNAGKTTLVLNIAGLLKPVDGRVLICGQNVQGASVTDLATKVGTVFQNPDEHITERTVRDEIGFPLRERQHERISWFKKRQRYDDHHIQDRVREACELVGIPEKLLDQDPVLLPAGLRRLVTIAEALVVNPQVISLDEPSVGLSATSRQRLQKTIARLKDMGKAILLTENDVDFVAEVADVVTVMDQGQIVLQGSVQDVFARNNWEQLAELYIYPPYAAQLADRLDMQATTVKQLISALSS